MADPKDEKYIVFKRSDWDAWTVGNEPPEPVEDAVVIRTRDIYAGPALHAYAHAAITTLEFLPERSPTRDTISKVIDYFISKAEEADIQRFHHKSQTPKAP